MGTSGNKPYNQGILCVFMPRNDEGAAMGGSTAKMKCELMGDKRKSCFLRSILRLPPVPVETM